MQGPQRSNQQSAITTLLSADKTARIPASYSSPNAKRGNAAATISTSVTGSVKTPPPSNVETTQTESHSSANLHRLVSKCQEYIESLLESRDQTSVAVGTLESNLNETIKQIDQLHHDIKSSCENVSSSCASTLKMCEEKLQKSMIESVNTEISSVKQRISLFEGLSTKVETLAKDDVCDKKTIRDALSSLKERMDLFLPIVEKKISDASHSVEQRSDGKISPLADRLTALKKEMLTEFQSTENKLVKSISDTASSTLQKAEVMFVAKSKYDVTTAQVSEMCSKVLHYEQQISSLKSEIDKKTADHREACLKISTLERTLVDLDTQMKALKLSMEQQQQSQSEKTLHLVEQSKVELTSLMKFLVEESGTKFEGCLKSLETDVKSLAEGVKTIGKDVTTIEKDVEIIEKDVGTIKKDVKCTEVCMELIKKTMSNAEEHIETVEKNLKNTSSVLESRLKILEKDLDVSESEIQSRMKSIMEDLKKVETEVKSELKSMDGRATRAIETLGTSFQSQLTTHSKETSENLISLEKRISSSQSSSESLIRDVEKKMASVHDSIKSELRTDVLSSCQILGSAIRHEMNALEERTSSTLVGMVTREVESSVSPIVTRLSKIGEDVSNIECVTKEFSSHFEVVEEKLRSLLQSTERDKISTSDAIGKIQKDRELFVKRVEWEAEVKKVVSLTDSIIGSLREKQETQLMEFKKLGSTTKEALSSLESKISAQTIACAEVKSELTTRMTSIQSGLCSDIGCLKSETIKLFGSIESTSAALKCTGVRLEDFIGMVSRNNEKMTIGTEATGHLIVEIDGLRSVLESHRQSSMSSIEKLELAINQKIDTVVSECRLSQHQQNRIESIGCRSLIFHEDDDYEIGDGQHFVPPPCSYRILSRKDEKLKQVELLVQICRPDNEWIDVVRIANFEFSKLTQSTRSPLSQLQSSSTPIVAEISLPLPESLANSLDRPGDSCEPSRFSRLSCEDTMTRRS